MTDLGLRKEACEAIGFRPFPAEEHRIEQVSLRPGEAQWLPGWWNPFKECAHTEETLPAIESDPGVSEPMFLEWCEKNDYQWQMATCEMHDRFTVRHLVLWVHDPETDFEVEVEGDTPSECRARAIVAAHRTKGEIDARAAKLSIKASLETTPNARIRTPAYDRPVTVLGILHGAYYPMTALTERPTPKALRECAEWLCFCLKIGWKRDQLDSLEELWWKYHDRTGRREPQGVAPMTGPELYEMKGECL